MLTKKVKSNYGREGSQSKGTMRHHNESQGILDAASLRSCFRQAKETDAFGVDAIQLACILIHFTFSFRSCSSSPSF